jgi:hypothetical protein
MVRWKRVVGSHRKTEAEGVFAVEIEPEQPLLSDKTEGLVQGQCCRVVKLGLKYNLQCGSQFRIKCEPVQRSPPLTSWTPSCFIFSTDCRMRDVAGEIK